MVGRTDRTGKAIDTDKYFVVSSNMLGSSYGSTAPRASILKPASPMVPIFPTTAWSTSSLRRRALLDTLGVKHLVAVAGLSFGGYQAFQWGVTFPDAMARHRPGRHARPTPTDGEANGGRFARALCRGSRMERRPSLWQRGDARLHDGAARRDAQALRHRG